MGSRMSSQSGKSRIGGRKRKGTYFDRPAALGREKGTDGKGTRPHVASAAHGVLPRHVVARFRRWPKELPK